MPRAFIDYEENNRWAIAALQACILHDHLMDAIRIHYNLDLTCGTRSTSSPIGDGVKELAEDYKGRGKELPLEFFIKSW
jgi:hypothetical protein